MKKIGLIGGGHHSRLNHLPALQHLKEVQPDKVELAAFCDLNPDVAQKTAVEFGFERYYTDISAMLRKETLDGIIAVTPVTVTRAVAEQIVPTGIPLVIEKPPGRDLKEASAICDLIAKHEARVMVSVNRRFDPALVAAKQWLADRKVAYFRASMFRNQRQEPTFFSETGLHALDAMRWFLGDIKSHSTHVTMVDGVAWRRVELAFHSGAHGLLEVLPTCGVRDERYEFFGANFHAVATNGEMSSGEFFAWENGKKLIAEEPAKGKAGFIRNGSLAETEEFIASLIEHRKPVPSPAETLQSMQICLDIQDSSLQI